MTQCSILWANTMVMPPGIIILEHKQAYVTWDILIHVHTRLGLYKPAYTLWHIIFIISPALTRILFSVTFELICRYIILTSLTHRFLSKDNSSCQFPSRTTSSSSLPSRTTHYIIFTTISPFGLDGNHDGVWSPQQIDTLSITIIQTPWYSPPLTSTTKGGSKTKQGFSSLV